MSESELKDVAKLRWAVHACLQRLESFIHASDGDPDGLQPARTGFDHLTAAAAALHASPKAPEATTALVESIEQHVVSSALFHDHLQTLPQLAEEMKELVSLADSLPAETYKRAEIQRHIQLAEASLQPDDGSA